VWTRFPFGENARLIGRRQSNIAMTVTMDVHKHGAFDKEGVFVEARILALGYTRESKNPLP
jgi:hypothetical protein